MKIIYWGVLLDEESRNLLKIIFPPKHPNVFAEHLTILFGPTLKQNNEWLCRSGEEVELFVIGEAQDEQGQAAMIHGIERVDGGIPHITISCANGTKPVYSNHLLQRGYKPKWPFPIIGKIGYFSEGKWKI